MPYPGGCGVADQKPSETTRPPSYLSAGDAGRLGTDRQEIIRGESGCRHKLPPSNAYPGAPWASRRLLATRTSRHGTSHCEFLLRIGGRCALLSTG